MYLRSTHTNQLICNTYIYVCKDETHCACVNVYARRACNYAYMRWYRETGLEDVHVLYPRRYLYPSAFGTRVIKRPRDLFPRTLAARGGSADPVLLPVYNYDLLRIPIRRDTARVSPARAKGFRRATSEGYVTRRTNLCPFVRKPPWRES